MKITIYDLIGLIKDNKAPKKIIYSSYVFKYTGDKRISRMYVMENQETYLFRDMVITLTNKVGILEDYLGYYIYQPYSKKIEKLNLPTFDEFKNMSAEERYKITAKEYILLNEIIEVLNEVNK